MMQRTISPVDGSVYAERPLTTDFEALLAPPPKLPLAERIAICEKLVTQFEAEADAFTAKAQELMTRHSIDSAMLAAASVMA